MDKNEILGEQPAYVEGIDVKNDSGEYVEVGGITNATVSVNGKTVTWTTYKNQGWEDNAITGKGFKVTLDGYRLFGDEGNDIIAETAFAIGPAANKEYRYRFADGKALEFKGATNVTAFAGGNATDLIPLKADILGKGKPTIASITE